MVRTTRLFALFVAIIGVHSLLGQEPKKQPIRERSVFCSFKSIDPEKKSITVETGGFKKEVKTYPLIDSVEIVGRGAKQGRLKLTDLSPGDILALFVDAESNNVTRIVSSGSAATSVLSGPCKEIDLDKKTIAIETGTGRFGGGDKKVVRSFPLGDSVAIRRLAGTGVLKLTDLTLGDELTLYIDPKSEKVTGIVLSDSRGDFKEIDLIKKTITIEIGSSRVGSGLGGKRDVKSFPLAESVEIDLVFERKKLTLTDLVPGDQLSLTIDPASKKVTRIGVQAASIPGGSIKEIDLEKKTIVIAPSSGEGQETRLPLSGKVTAEKYFRTIPLGDVKPGMKIIVVLGDDRKSVSRMIVYEPNSRSIMGVIRMLDATNRTITLNYPTFGGLKPIEPTTYKVAENAAIKILGKEGKLTDLDTGISISAYTQMDLIVGVSVNFTTSRNGTIAKIDFAKSTVTLKIYDELITGTVTPDTKIRQLSRAIKLADLKEGQGVGVMFSADKKTLESITVHFQSPK